MSKVRGALGERIAEWFLARRGYRVVERNARVGRFEVDLVVERGALVVFVEVKMRGAAAWGGASRALGGAQRIRLAAAASALSRRYPGRDLRFDLITIEESLERLVVEHLTDAMGAGGALR